MNTRNWKRDTLDLRTGIRLDPRNVRLETINAKVEADIMEDLFANESTLGLVEGICAIGYLTHEIPIVTIRRGTNVVVEGNRRIAALKAMQNPMLVPDFRNRISALLKRYPNHPRISEVDVLVAPSQDEADQLIAAIHTGNLRKAWNPTRQAAFFQAQIDAGRNYEELVTRYPTSDVKKYVLRARVVNRFKIVEYDSPELLDFVASSKFRRGLSTLARIYEAKDFRILTGLKLEDDGRLDMSLSESEFAEIASVIVKGMREGSLNTRTLNKVRDNPRFTQLMSELKTVTGSSTDSRTGKTKEKAFSTSTGRVDRSLKVTISRRPRASKDRYLAVSRLSIPETYGEGFKQTIQELSVTDVRGRPATVFLLMRAALEKGIKSFAEAKGIEIRTSGNNQQGYVYLSNCMKWLSEYAKRNGDRWVAQVISNMSQLVYYTISTDKLNAVNHNHKMYVTTDEAIDMWRSVVSLLEYVVKS